LLAILFAGGFVSGKNTISGVVLGSILTIIILIIYIFFDMTYLEKYSVYTDELIKKKSKN